MQHQPFHFNPNPRTARQGARVLRALLCAVLLGAVPPGLTFAASAATGAAAADAEFVAAREAFRNGEAVKLGRKIEALRDHPLLPWAEYWRERLRLDDDVSAGVPDFLARHAGSYLADKLRGDWLRWLGKKGDRETFNREYPALVQADDELRCLAAQAAADAEMVRPLWLSGQDLPAACEALAATLADAGKLSADDVWSRIRRLLEAKKVGAARAAASRLAAKDALPGKELESAAADPARALSKLPAKFAATRGGRETALFAVQRMARGDPEQAARQLEKIEAKLGEEERAYAWGRIALAAAMLHQPDAADWYAKAGATALTDEQRAWQVRAALRAGDWSAVRKAIEAMPAALAAQPDWVYWRARAFAAQGRREEANTLYETIAGQPHFYSNLADEELGRDVSVPARAADPTKEELAAAVSNPAFQRAIALMRVDMRLEGVREWIFAIRGMDDRQLLAAAAFARNQEIWDRAINTADKTKQQHNFDLRYLAPYRDQVRPKARQLALDDAWVYGLMRQESRFVMNAKSSAGAKGLMQLMPATAKWVAKKINLADYHPGRVAEMDTNVTLGTHYMKMVLDSLDNHPVLASAAYNAGPGRARRWRAERTLEGAIYAETIPFTETRDYVKKVMSNAVYYATLFESRSHSLKQRLGTIRARGAGEQGVEELP